MKKKTLGQFFTKNTSSVLLPHILRFITESGKTVLYDPFAGGGDLLNQEIDGITDRRGLDIDTSLGWDYNDSLVSIPILKDSLIFTNPPYYGKSSAKRNKDESVLRYFEGHNYTDLYQIALERCLSASDYVVAIIPESYINSSFPKTRCVSITTIEENPFEDTECPVCVACFGKEVIEDTLLYKNADYVGTLSEVESFAPVSSVHPQMKFNDKSGWLAIRCIDDIKFGYTSDFTYDFNKNIKVSSRSYTLVSIDVPVVKRDALIKEANDIMGEIRTMTKDLLLTPFKGNRNGVRRRRLDFALARAVIEKAYEIIS